MRMVDLIEKKKHNQRLSDDEWHYIIDGLVKGEIPDYQISALLMAVYFNGLTEEETAILTREMMYSGEVYDLSEIAGIKVDKHSTGGVGDKTSLALCPMLAACGLNVAKMSGRGLGHTGGTLDKLESIPGFQVQIAKEDFMKQVSQIHLAIIGQSETLVPADQKLYALRDVTATIDSIPLIASSIMSKKLAAGTDVILLDVKYGDGAFMRTVEEAEKLAETMIRIGTQLNRRVQAAISNMEQPLGLAIGNTLELKEAIATLRGQGPQDFTELCLTSGATLLMMAGMVSNQEEARALLQAHIDDGLAFACFKAMVKAQGGDVSSIDHPEKLPQAKEVIAIPAKESGYVHELRARTLGLVSMKLGGGREKKGDTIDHTVGLMLHKKVGDYVKQGETLVSVHTNSGLSEELMNEVYSAYMIQAPYIDKPKLVEKIIGGK